MDVSFQLYSSRNGGPISGVLKMLSEAGYSQVEGFGGVYGDPAALKDLLDQNGLTMPSGHFFPISEFDYGLEKTLAAAKMLGMERLFCPAPEDHFRNGASAAEWGALGVRLDEASRKVRDAGLRFGWHNHHWEFQTLDNGQLAMDILLECAPAMEWEADIAWIVRGGADPFDWIENHGARITAAHVKDIAPEGEAADEDGWADLGQGIVDWPAILSALRKGGTDLFVLEHDNPSDPARFARRSIAAFRQL